MSDLGPKPSVPYWHLWTDEDGVSHLTECRIGNFQPHSVGSAAPQCNNKQGRSESTVVFTTQPAGWIGEWHENPASQWIVVLSGRWFTESMDGSRMEQGPGELSLGKDQGCIARGGRGTVPGPSASFPAA
jgi:hypothetical protein